MLPILTILHPTDFSDQSEHAFALARGLARDYGAQLQILHVADVPNVDGFSVLNVEAIVTDARRQFDKLQQECATAGYNYRLERGYPTHEILRVAQLLHADLIVMGTHGRTGLSRLLMGSVAEEVVRKSLCPVLTVSGPVKVKDTLRRESAARSNGSPHVVPEASDESLHAADRPAWIGEPYV